MSNSSETTSDLTIIMNHMITNQFELYAYSVLYALILLLYGYQCYKIYLYYSDFQEETRINRQFEILFAFATLLRMIQIEYSLIGFAMDENKDLHIGNQQILFCDPLFHFTSKFKCHSNYKVYAIFSSLSFLIFNIIVQFISMFWTKSVSIQSLIFNSERSTRKDFAFIFFSIINIAQLALYIVAYFYSYNNKIMIILKIYEYVACLLTFIYFIYQGMKYYNVNKDQTNQKDQKIQLIISLGIFFCILTKFIYLTYRLTQNGKNLIQDGYSKSIQMSILIYVMIVFDQLIFRILIVKLF